MIWYIEILLNVVINADCLKTTFIKRSFIHSDTIKPLLRILLRVERIVGSKQITILPTWLTKLLKYLVS